MFGGNCMAIKAIILITVLFFLYFAKEKSVKGAIISFAIFMAELYAAKLLNTSDIDSGTNPSVAPTQDIKATVEASIEDTFESSPEEDVETEVDFIFPDSDRRKITKSDLEKLTQWELRIARNEIYARKGRIFETPELRDYFNGKSWYEGTIEPDEFTNRERELLSEIEFQNAVFIDKYEKSLGYYYD